MDYGPEDHTPIPYNQKQIRDLIFSLNIDLSVICSEMIRFDSHIITKNTITPMREEEDPSPYNLPTHEIKQRVQSAACQFFDKILSLSLYMSFDLQLAIISKIHLNSIKYPYHLCSKDESTKTIKKYDNYSKHTGINRNTSQPLNVKQELFPDHTRYKRLFYRCLLPLLIHDLYHFIEERNWFKFEHPRNLCLAVMGELGELAELFQFRSDFVNVVDLEYNDFNKIAQEIADVAIYFIRLVGLLNISLSPIE